MSVRVVSCSLVFLVPLAVPLTLPFDLSGMSRMAEKILSDRQCATAKCEPQKTELLLSDGGNLYLRIRDSGEKNGL